MRKYLIAVSLAALVVASFGTARASQTQDQSQKPADGSQPAASPPAASPNGQASQSGQTGQNGQAAPAGQAQTAPAAPAITPEENKAYSAIQNELDPVRQL